MWDERLTRPPSRPTTPPSRPPRTRAPPRPKAPLPSTPATRLGADSSGAVAAEAAPEVPDDARSTIARAQEHIDNLDMDAEREAAERTIKQH